MREALKKFEITSEEYCDILVVGGGPAGLSAAICAARINEERHA